MTAPPKKSLGQHFLISPGVIAKTLRCLDPRPTDAVLEIGPGRGALTLPLLESGARVCAIEKDRTLAARLRREWPALTVITGDALRHFPRVPAGWPAYAEAERRCCVGNLPYNVATPILRLATECAPAWDRFVFMVQREVGERIVSPPGRKAYGSLSVLMQLYFRARRICVVPPGAFAPPPKVDSAVIQLLPRRDIPTDGADAPGLARFIHRCFQTRRKTLANRLMAEWGQPRPTVLARLAELEVPPTARPEQLPPRTFLALYRRSRA